MGLLHIHRIRDKNDRHLFANSSLDGVRVVLGGQAEEKGDCFKRLVLMAPTTILGSK
jgi:hypothetical protein